MPGSFSPFAHQMLPVMLCSCILTPLSYAIDLEMLNNLPRIRSSTRQSALPAVLCAQCLAQCLHLGGVQGTG